MRRVGSGWSALAAFAKRRISGTAQPRNSGGRVMKVRFQADADLDGRVPRGLRRAVPESDIRTAADAGLAGHQDSEVLRLAAADGRILISQDRRTMPGHFRRFVAGAASPGVILIRDRISVATAIEERRNGDVYTRPEAVERVLQYYRGLATAT